ncbi:ribonuclease D [Candidatus Woesearchaeota archaeon]|nr:ribonuclease D [Candidatus Woesearchaeota archaeon]
MEYIYVDNEQKLEKTCKELETQKTIAIDLECENNLHHYGSYISIIQISTKEKNWVVDILAIKQIEPLKKILENEEIQKIFHDVSFDLRILKYELNIQPKNLFDTQIAALFIGEKNVGLGSLLEKYFSINKESKFQMADWTIRPINPEMMTYAVKDTLYLIKLKELLETRIEELNRTTWLREELKHLEQKEYYYKEPEFEDLKGVSKLNQKEKIFAQKLYEERETIAKKTDKPAYKIISNRKILEITQNPPRTKEEWTKIRGIHPRIKAMAPRLYYETQKLNIKQEPQQKRERKNYTEEQKTQLQELEDTRVKIGNQLGIEPYLIMTKDQVHEVVRNKNYKSLREWQKELVLKETKLFT